MDVDNHATERLKAWRQEIRENIIYVLSRAAKDVEAERNRQHDPDQPETFTKKIGGFLRGDFFQLTRPSSAIDIKLYKIVNSCAGALAFCSDEERLEKDGVACADYFIRDWAKNDLILRDEMYDMDHPDVVRDLLDSFRKVEKTLTPFRLESYFREKNPEKFDNLNDRNSRLIDILCLLHDVQDALKEMNFKPSCDADKPSPWAK